LRTLLIKAQTPVSIRVEHSLFDNAAAIAAVARSVAEELGGYGLDPTKVHVLGNGVDTVLFRPAEEGEVACQSKAYVFAAGRLDLRKGFEDLVEAMPNVARQVPDVCLYIAGDGPLRGELKARVERLGLGHVVRFLGHVGRGEMLSYYQGATVFAHAAHYEGLPTVLLEALACGRAVVSTAVSGALDVVEDGVNGLLVPPRAPDKLAHAICRLLADARLRARLGAAARRTVEERFSWQVVGHGYLQCYRQLLNGGGLEHASRCPA
jgi:glycosyltransferase involved in cell wall biosynthesis